MNYSRIKKLSFFLVASFLIFNIFSIIPSAAATDWNSSLSWDAQAAGCQPVSNNINAVINQAYLGATVPANLLSQYPNASAGFLPYFKSELVGMKLNQFKSFDVPPGQGYTTGPYANQDLFFEVTILQILNDVNNSGITTTNSLVNVQYSLFTGCQKPSAGFLGGIIPSSTTPLFLGAFVVVSILAVVGYVVYSGRNPNLNTEKIIKKTKEREEKNIKSLKDTLDIKEETNTPSQKKPSSVRRRR